MRWLDGLVVILKRKAKENEPMYRLTLERWHFCLAWLSAGLTGVLPEPLWQTLGVLKTMLAVARPVAAMLHPWMLMVLAERQRRGLALPQTWLNPEAATRWRLELLARRFTHQEVQRPPSWLLWRLEAELTLLPQLAEVPSSCLSRPGWLACEVCYWALAIRCVRIGQLYYALEAQVEPAEAQRGIEAALERASQRLMLATQAA